VADLADAADIGVTGDPTRARDTVAEALTARGFTLTWTDEWNGVAAKGSRTKQLIFGAFAMYFEVGVSVFAVNGASVVRLTRPSTGVTGGLAGRAQARKQFTTLTAELTEVYRTAGVLLAQEN
jgi:hypothetical protein